MLQKLVAKTALTIPTHGGVWQALAALGRTQWLSLPTLRACQTRRLRALLQHARRTVPYYRNLKPDLVDIKEIAELERIPVLTRKLVRANYAQLQSRGVPGNIFQRSGGSTGEPVTVRKNPSVERMESASLYRQLQWVGLDFGHRTGTIIPFRGRTVRAFGRAVLDLLTSRVSVNMFDLSEEKLAKFVRRLRGKRIALLSNPTALLLLANFVSDHQTNLDVAFVLSESDQLLEEERKRISRMFGASVYDMYGSGEISFIAAECPHTVGHHISLENVIIEVVGNSGEHLPNGRIGSLVITDLNNYAMPLIRYQIGDLSTLLDDECPCGRGLPMLGPIEGRLTDVLVTPDDRYMCISTFGSRVLYQTHVDEFQVYQPSKSEVVIRAVMPPRWQPVEGPYIQQRVQSIMGKIVKVSVEFCDKLERRPSGKRQLVKSEIMPRIPD